MADEIESEKGHTCFPIEVRTQKARLACVMPGSNAGQIVSRAGPAGSMIPEATRGGCAHLDTAYVIGALILYAVTSEILTRDKLE